MKRVAGDWGVLWLRQGTTLLPANDFVDGSRNTTIANIASKYILSSISRQLKSGPDLEIPAETEIGRN
jgi:hypothetical protein